MSRLDNPLQAEIEAAGLEDVAVEKQATPRANKALGRKFRQEKTVAHNVFRLGYLVHDVSRMRRTLCDQHMRPIGITRSQWWVLANLSRQSVDGTSSTELARMLDVGKVTVGGIIDRLETAGYVYRRVDKNDRRAKRIFITQAGYALIAKMREVLGPLNQGICAGLEPEEIDQVERYLAIIRSNLRGMLAESELETFEEAEVSELH
jgi:DNA-binding MarR family transcriptional regulator